jgi:hypothetical protein
MTGYSPEYRPAQPPAPWTAPPPPPGVTPARRRSRPLVVAALFVGVLVAGAGIGLAFGLLTRSSNAPTSSGTSTVAQARSLYQQALVATRASAGVHYVGVSTDGTVTQRTIGDATRQGGSQVITINTSFGDERFTLRLVGSTVYFQGNTPAVEDQLGVPAASAASVQGKWVSVSSSDGPYSVLQPGITVADQTQGMALSPTGTQQITTANGTKATRILGTQPGASGGSAHLDIANDSHLPIASVSTVSAGGVTATSSATFSAWGRAASPAAPTGAVAWSTLGASAPPGGYGGGGNGGTGPGASPTPGA